MLTEFVRYVNWCIAAIYAYVIGIHLIYFEFQLFQKLDMPLWRTLQNYIYNKSVCWIFALARGDFTQKFELQFLWNELTECHQILTRYEVRQPHHPAESRGITISGFATRWCQTFSFDPKFLWIGLAWGALSGIGGRGWWPLQTTPNQFLIWCTVWGQGPERNFWKFQSNIFPQSKFSQKFSHW